MRNTRRVQDGLGRNIAEHNSELDILPRDDLDLCDTSLESVGQSVQANDANTQGVNRNENFT